MLYQWLHIADWNTTDFMIVAVFFVSVCVGLVRGFAKEVLSLCAWVGAIGLSMQCGSLWAESIPYLRWIHTPFLRFLFVCLLIFMVVLILASVVGIWVKRCIHFAGLWFFDCVLGAGFGFLRVLLVMSVIVLMGQQIKPQETWWARSYLLPQFIPPAHWIAAMFPSQVKTISDFLISKEREAG